MGDRFWDICTVIRLFWYYTYCYYPLVNTFPVEEFPMQRYVIKTVYLIGLKTFRASPGISAQRAML